MSTTKLEWVLSAKDQASDVFDKVGDKIDGTASKFDKFKRGAVIGATAAAGGLAVLATKSIQAGEEASTSNDRTLQVLDSMGLYGDEAQKVGDRINTLANATARKTGIDQNQIKAAQSILLTFGEVTGTADEAGGAFDRATQAAIDLAATGFGSAESNATQLGKALNDPIKGIGALAEAGVTFTEQEKKQIAAMVDTGDMAGAQNKILGALETQVGGVAEATANSSDKMKVGWSQVSETIGLALLPAFEKFSGVMESLTGFVTKHQGATMALLGVIGGLAAVILIASGAQKIFAAGTLVVKGAQAIATAAQWAWNAAMSANPIGLIIAGIALLVAGLVWFFTKTEVGRKAWSAMIDGLVAGWNWFWEDVLKPGIDAVVAAWNWLWDSAIKPVVDFIVDYVKMMGAVYTWLWENAIKPAFDGIVGGVLWLKDQFIEKFDLIKDGVETAIGFVTDKFQSMLDFFEGAPGKIGGFFSGIGDYITRPFKNAFNGIASMWNRSVGRLSFTVPDIIGVPNRGETFSFPKMPSLYTGGQITRGGLATINERGAEVVRLPTGTTVYPHGTGPAQANSGPVRLHPDDIAALGGVMLAGANVALHN